MTEVHVHCANANGRLLDARVAEVDDLIEAREYAKCVARSLIAAPTLRDWRDCWLRVSDDLGEEIFTLPFASIVGRPH